jgi:DNA-binding IclR family transcriptional regulator
MADNTIPAVERTLRLFETLERASGGKTANELGDELGVPRTTLYRILRMLAPGGYVVAKPGDASLFVLGPAFGRLAGRAARADTLAASAQPVLDALCARLNETVKIVVREGAETVAIAVSHPREDSRIAARLGARLPLHIGAGQRLLLAHAPAEVVDSAFAAGFARRASETITDPAEMRACLARLRKRDWELGRSEGTEGVGTVAAVVREPGRPVRAAIIALYIQAAKSRAEVLGMRDEVLAAAERLSEAC